MPSSNMSINREASDKTKGFRLQKIRVIEYMLDGIATCPKPLFYSAIEHIEGIYVKDRSNDGDETLEENKNYDPGSKFTFNSHEILNTKKNKKEKKQKKQNREKKKQTKKTTKNYGKEQTSKVVTDNNI